MPRAGSSPRVPGAAREGPDPDARAAGRPPSRRCDAWCARPSCYLVPRPDGRVVVGATQEERSDRDVTAAGVFDLLEDALHIAPELAELRLAGAAAGLRPATDELRPAIGADDDGLVWATGGFRHGVLLLPLAGRGDRSGGARRRRPRRRAFAVRPADGSHERELNGRPAELAAGATVRDAGRGGGRRRRRARRGGGRWTAPSCRAAPGTRRCSTRARARGAARDGGRLT